MSSDPRTDRVPQDVLTEAAQLINLLAYTDTIPSITRVAWVVEDLLDLAAQLAKEEVNK